jgi:diaminopimelate decarboxylase
VVAAGILLNIESFREVDLLTRASDALGIAARVALRVNLPFELRGSGMKMSGGARPFGVDAERVPELLRQIGERQLGFEGFHLFAGSQNLRAEAIIEAQTHSYALVLGWLDACPVAPVTLNLGGGFGIPYAAQDKRLDVPAVADNLDVLRPTCPARCLTPISPSNWAVIWWAKPASMWPASSTARFRGATCSWCSMAACTIISPHQAILAR